MKHTKLETTSFEKKVEVYTYDSFQITVTSERKNGPAGTWKVSASNSESLVIKGAVPIIAGDRFLEALDFWNPFTNNGWHRGMKCPSHYPSWLAELLESCKSPFTLPTEGGLKSAAPEQVYHMVYGTHSLFDHTGNQVPLLMLLDYCGSPVSTKFTGTAEGLERMHAHLKSHPCVKHITDIELIPYYNNDSGDSKFFTVSVRPTPEVYERILQCKNPRDVQRCAYLSAGRKDQFDWLDLLQFEGKQE